MLVIQHTGTGKLFVEFAAVPTLEPKTTASPGKAASFCKHADAAAVLFRLGGIIRKEWKAIFRRELGFEPVRVINGLERNGRRRADVYQYGKPVGSVLETCSGDFLLSFGYNAGSFLTMDEALIWIKDQVADTCPDRWKPGDQANYASKTHGLVKVNVLRRDKDLAHVRIPGTGELLVCEARNLRPLVQPKTAWEVTA